MKKYAWSMVRGNSTSCRGKVCISDISIPSIPGLILLYISLIFLAANHSRTAHPKINSGQRIANSIGLILLASEHLDE